MVIAEKAQTVLAQEAKRLQFELEEVRRNADGVLYPRDVVAYAEDATTALHSQFEWDDSKAGYAYRIWQARHLIRTVVTMIPNTGVMVEAYVSLKVDRYEDGGYRAIVEVLSDKEQYRQLLADALSDLEVWEQKYRQLAELKPIFKTAKQLREKM